jgi:hypothetical protein
LRPWDIIAYHFQEQSFEMMPGPVHRAVRTANAQLYQQLAHEVPPGYTVVNVADDDEVEAMFFSGRNVYAGVPSAAEARLLQARSAGLATYGSHATPALPTYLTAPGILQLWGTPQ